MSVPEKLSRRERQIMEAIYRSGEATVAEVHAALPDAASYNAVRNLMAILEAKGHLTHREDGPRYVYLPTQPRTNAARSALSRVVETFFGGSVEQAVTTLLSGREAALSDEAAARIAVLIEEARRREGEEGEKETSHDNGPAD